MNRLKTLILAVIIGSLSTFSGTAFAAAKGKKPTTYEELMGLPSLEEQLKKKKVEPAALLHRAEQGDDWAQAMLGMMYEFGFRGVAQDYGMSLKWYQLAADQGASNAQVALGDMYKDGKGIVQDYKAALKWYELAAEQGDFFAQFKLGEMYYEGKGIKDYTRAHMWWNIAASQGLEIAAENRNKVENDMTSSQVGKAQKLARECVAKNYKGC